MKIKELQTEQRRLGRRVQLQTLPEMKLIGGAYCTQKADQLICCVVTLSYPDLEIKEKAHYILHNPLPLKQGFLAYRELPGIVEAFNSLQEEPEVLLIMGPGIAHPQGCGIASHAGLNLNTPTIGITEKPYWGEVNQDNELILNEKQVGFSLQTKEHGKPIYISPGHLTDFKGLKELVSKLIVPPHKLPEPLHIARKCAKKLVSKSL